MQLTDDILEQYLQNILPLRIHVKKPAWQFLTMIYLITIRFPNGEESRQDVLSHMNSIHSSIDDIHSLFEFVYFHIFLNHEGLPQYFKLYQARRTIVLMIAVHVEWNEFMMRVVI